MISNRSAWNAIKHSCNELIISIFHFNINRAEHYPVLRKIVDEKGYLAGAWKTMIGDLDQASLYAF